MPYYHVRDELSTQDGIVLRGDRATIPKSLRSRMLTRIHQSYMGIEACLRFAKDCVYWPGMNAEVKDYVSRCDICQTVGRKQQKETLEPHPIPQRPWERVGTDLFTFQQREYLITVDYHSNYFEIDMCENVTRASTIVKKLKAQFARHGIPDVVISDNRPQSTADEFEKFAKNGTSNTKHPRQAIHRVMVKQRMQSRQPSS
ncbi:PREDICTED: uncharacterized protein K02A2.6-like [Branchiostoma belcheri]|uniref:Gypsy retrotransposon integrase-like protein 1 n=1 Tax=Branchiostoma belcheri TaxID=7741 RepID=A0A6P4ZJE5_BRABE|nr:PREDICTED: uncharacterized protein K02A2.6-like [Branchiostoma belcheri]KAI8511995.1 hypothetical protein Bbelb_110950 [Branchiostoma belcheri]